MYSYFYIVCGVVRRLSRYQCKIVNKLLMRAYIHNYNEILIGTYAVFKGVISNDLE